MAQQTGISEEITPPIRNAGAGTLFVAPAGGFAEAAWDFVNDSPDVAGFYLQVDGLPADWVVGAGESFAEWAAASGGGVVRLKLTPPLAATVGDYPFLVTIISGGAAVGAGSVSLVLRVTPALEVAVSPPADEIAVAAPIADSGQNMGDAPSTIDSRIADSPSAQLAAMQPTSSTAAQAPTPPPPAAQEPTVAPQPTPSPPVAQAPITQTPAIVTEHAPTPAAQTPAIVAQAVPQPTIAQAPVTAPSVTPSPVAQVPAVVPQAVTPPPVVQRPVTPPPVAHAPASVQQSPRPTPVAPPPVIKPTAPTPTPEIRLAVPPKPAPLEEEPLTVIDYNSSPRGATEAHSEVDVEEKVPTEPSIVDPKDGTVIALCPGDTQLVRFGFVNESSQERTYILDEDRSLETSWITLVQDQVNLTRNGHGEVSVRLTPPKNAEPGDYPFNVTVGLHGGTLTPISLVLSILATPAVRLTAKVNSVTVGPFGSTIDFPLIVDSAGNADTAFRIGVKSPDSKTDSTKTPGPDIVYETAQWRYLFDRELETLRSPSFGRAPQPVPVRLRLQRRGIWWLGFRESHQVCVGVVPVTDPANGGKPDNSVNLTAVRWRLLPFPAFVLVPIVLALMLFLSGSASTIEVPNAYQDEGGQYWVVSPAGDKKDLTLQWKAPAMALLRLTGQSGDKQILSKPQVGSGGYSQQVTVSSQDRKVTNVYRISRLVGGGDRDAVVSFVFTRSDTPLLVTDAGSSQPLTGPDVTLPVARTGFTRLDLKNISPQSTRIDWWLTKSLHDDSPFKFLYVKDSGSIEQGGVEHLIISRNPSAPANAADRIVFVTTDANRPVVTVNLTSGQ